MRGVGEQAADRDDSVDVKLKRETDDFADERAPLHTGLDPANDDEIWAVRDRGRVGRGGRPGDLSNATLADGDHRAVHLEVVVVLGVDIGEPLAGELIQDVVDQTSRGLSGVIPALEGREQHRLVEWR